MALRALKLETTHIPIAPVDSNKMKRSQSHLLAAIVKQLIVSTYFPILFV